MSQGVNVPDAEHCQLQVVKDSTVVEYFEGLGWREARKEHLIELGRNPTVFVSHSHPRLPEGDYFAVRWTEPRSGER